MPWTLANFRALLAEGARAESRCTHQQIKNWADGFWRSQSEQPFSLGHVLPTRIQAAAEIAQEIELQWDMNLQNTYTLSQLQRLDFSSIRLPESWFADWLVRLEQLGEDGTTGAAADG